VNEILCISFVKCSQAGTLCCSAVTCILSVRNVSRLYWLNWASYIQSELFT